MCQISVKAEDLQRALNPEVWPLRVKVREFIYYSRKSGQKSNDSNKQPGQSRQDSEGKRNVEQGHGQGQEHSGERGQPDVPTSNRFSALENGQPDADILVV